MKKYITIIMLVELFLNEYKIKIKENVKMSLEIINFSLIAIIVYLAILAFFYFIREGSLQKKYIFKELKKKKEVFIHQNEFKYTATKGIFLKVIDMLLKIIIANIVLIYIAKYFNRYEITESIFLAIVIDVLFLINVYLIINKLPKNIQIKDYMLLINSTKESKRYEINNIDRLKIRVFYDIKLTKLYFYIKDQYQNKCEKYTLNFYSPTKIIALIIFIECIKQNNIEAIDTMSLDDIETFRDQMKDIDIHDIEVRQII